ncbi:MAG: DEAD/DEAH box helicase, partial [Acidimicrobiales bacterium]
MDEPWLEGRRIVMLEPRRLAARAAARRMADLVGEQVGGLVGFRTRDQRAVSDRTRIEVVTEGILTRRLQSDPTLPGVGLVIFDEFHERSVHADLAIAFLREALEARDDLRVLVMSATLDAVGVADYLGGAAVVEVAGAPHPVEIAH